MQDGFGLKLFPAQTGQRLASVKPFSGATSGTFELIEGFDGDTCRAIGTVRVGEAIYVLHVFKTKTETKQQDSAARHRPHQAAVEDR